MTMTARECLQALLDGKILRDGDYRYWRMSDEGELQTKWEARDNWICAGVIWNGGCTIQEEYSLTFKDALKAMIDGKIVESENSKCKYFLASACGVTFAEMTEDEPNRILITTIKVPEQIGKWKVVE